MEQFFHYLVKADSFPKVLPNFVFLTEFPDSTAQEMLRNVFLRQQLLITDVIYLSKIEKNYSNTNSFNNHACKYHGFFSFFNESGNVSENFALLDINNVIHYIIEFFLSIGHF